MSRSALLLLLLVAAMTAGVWLGTRRGTAPSVPGAHPSADPADAPAEPRRHDATNPARPNPTGEAPKVTPSTPRPGGEGGNPWDPEIPTSWLPLEVHDDTGPDTILLGLLHHPERPPVDEDVAEPAQDELVLYVLLEDPREVTCRVTTVFDSGDGRGSREISVARNDFSKEHPSIPRLTRAGVFFDPGVTLKRGEVFEARVTTRDPSGAVVRDLVVRHETR